MKISETTSLLQAKIAKIIRLLLLVRLTYYIPIPSIELDIFSQATGSNSIFSFAKSLAGNSLTLGSLGIIPYINASIIIQLLTSIIPSLERLQKEEGEFGRQKITKYTRYLTFFWALALSSGIAFFIIKPLIFNWTLLVAAKIILALTTGSLLLMWFAELITEEKLGNGSSMIIFINIVGGLPNILREFPKLISDTSYYEKLLFLVGGILIYICIVLLIVLFQDAYKKIDIISAKQLNINAGKGLPASSKFQSSYLPLKLNQGGIMPLVFSSTISTFFYYPVQLIASSSFALSLKFLPFLIAVYTFGLNIGLTIFFSGFYALLILKPNEISANLAKMTYIIPNIRQGNQTTIYLKQVISRLAFVGGLFLAFLAFFPIIIGNIFHFNVFKNVTSLLILIGVITDTTTQIRGYLISRNYEGFKKT